jgi:uncharacterized membrane protein
MNTPSEPMLIGALLSSVLGLLVMLGVFGLTTDQATAITAAASALFMVVAGMFTRPVSPGLWTAAVTAMADLAATFGVHWSVGTVAAVNLVVVSFLAAVFRGHVTPTTTRGKAV